MRQLLLLILVFFASQWLFKKLRRAQSASGAPGAPGATHRGYETGAGAQARAGSNVPQLPDPLVRCAECGVHTPRSESVVAAGHRFCSVDHAKRHTTHPAGPDA